MIVVLGEIQVQGHSLPGLCAVVAGAECISAQNVNVLCGNHLQLGEKGNVIQYARDQRPAGASVPCGIKRQPLIAIGPISFHLHQTDRQQTILTIEESRPVRAHQRIGIPLGQRQILLRPGLAEVERDLCAYGTGRCHRDHVAVDNYHAAGVIVKTVAAAQVHGAGHQAAFREQRLHRERHPSFPAVPGFRKRDVSAACSKFIIFSPTVQRVREVQAGRRAVRILGPGLAAVGGTQQGNPAAVLQIRPAPRRSACRENKRPQEKPALPAFDQSRNCRRRLCAAGGLMSPSHPLHRSFAGW